MTITAVACPAPDDRPSGDLPVVLMLIDETFELFDRNWLVGGMPGSGESGLAARLALFAVLAKGRSCLPPIVEEP